MQQENRQKKITFCCEIAAYGGVETVFKHYCDFLNPQYKLTVISAGKIPENFIAYFTKNNISYYSQKIKKEKFYHPIKYIAYKIKKYRRDNKQDKILSESDIIIDFKNGGLNNWLQQNPMPDIPKILWIHGGLPFVEECMKNLNWSIYDKIVCLTDSLKNDLIKMYPQYQDKFLRIYNPMDIETIRQKAQTPISPKAKFFTHVSRLGKDKDIKTLLDGYELFYQKTQSPYQLYIIGDGSQKQRYENHASKLSSFPQIKFLGKKENPFPYMREAEAVLLSSPSEGLPCVLIEALACTKGVVAASDCPNGPAEILGYGKYGTLFEVGNASQLADILQQISEQKILRNFTDEELEEHLSQFSLSSIQEALQKLLV